MAFQIEDMPAVQRDKHLPLVNALVALPPGKSIRVPLEMFKHSPGPNLRLKQRIGRTLHVRKMPDGWYLWLEPVPATNGNGAA